MQRRQGQKPAPHKEQTAKCHRGDPRLCKADRVFSEIFRSTFIFYKRIVKL